MQRWLALVTVLVSHSAWADRPNIVFILADDLGYGDVGCNNPSSKIPTPNIDRLAREGLRFTDGHSAAACCTPSRYAILTGQYGFRSKLRSGVSPPWGTPLIATGDFCIASSLQQAGYRTACVGKWHLGWDWPTRDGKPAQSGPDRLSNVDFSRPIASGPLTLGFHRYFGVDLPNYPPYCFIDQDRTVGVPTEPSSPPINRPGPMMKDWDQSAILPATTREAVQFIEENAKSPFFLYWPLTVPHYPVVPSKEYVGRTSVGAYGDFVVQMDESVGAVVAALERAGVRDDTLVIFTSDNGPEVAGEVPQSAYERFREHGHDSRGGFRGVKRDLWEGGHRVPFIAHWPARIEPGRVSDETVSGVDVAATLASLMDLPIPERAAGDSVDFSPVLLDEDYESPLREALIYQACDRTLAIRQGDWVLIQSKTGDRNAKNGEPAWLKEQEGYTPHDQPGELFNLKEDPQQKHNVYAENLPVVGKLSILLGRYIAEGRSVPIRTTEE